MQKPHIVRCVQCKLDRPTYEYPRRSLKKKGGKWVPKKNRKPICLHCLAGPDALAPPVVAVDWSKSKDPDANPTTIETIEEELDRVLTFSSPPAELGKENPVLPKTSPPPTATNTADQGNQSHCPNHDMVSSSSSTTSDHSPVFGEIYARSSVGIKKNKRRHRWRETK
jgi:hypothetical protein